MKTTIGAFDAATKQVKVIFTEGEIRHERPVNAVMKDGNYDKIATKERVAEVARGVAVKISVGAISTPPVLELPTEAE
ncbi:hypothetical protein C1T17_16415 [Sphingobium sp. SCG-1]|uniref:hypothetical protein n=1 Tax=Sphingobium sp. SCG-1 TaxID=2072936 RepID=UPI000CD6A9F8|nr:hypothetical protein [Sphingobium sp. SCG-1]AUW59435.1 hypothetical protein C1T17_16415 [Sphingobium sp. SCG-1]